MRRKMKVDPGQVVRVVGDGMIMAVDVFGGAPVPVLVLDCEKHPQIAEAIRVSEYEPDGDVRVLWGRDKRYVGLVVELVRPAPVSFVISFDLETQGILVELALTAGAVQIKAGDGTSTFKSTFNHNGLYIEVPPRDEFPPWPAIFISALMDVNRRQGARPLDARRAADSTYEWIASLASARIKSPRPSGPTRPGESCGPSALTDVRETRPQRDR